MKKIKIIFSICCFCILSIYCNKKDKIEMPQNSCEFSDPLIDLLWLKEMVEKFDSDAAIMEYSPAALIYQCNYKYGTGFLLNMCDGCPNESYIFRGCDGIILCEILYIEGNNDIAKFDIDFENKELIWERESNPLLEKHNLKRIETETIESIIYDVETGVVRLINENYVSELDDVVEVAMSYLQEKADIFGISINETDIKLDRVWVDLAGTIFVDFNQYLNNIQVYAGIFRTFNGRSNGQNILLKAQNMFRNVALYDDVFTIPAIEANEALKIAFICLNVIGEIIGDPVMQIVYFESIDKGLELAWKIDFSSLRPLGKWEIFVSAIDKNIIQVTNIDRPFN